MTRDFANRFGLQVDLVEAKRRFVNRAQNAVFQSITSHSDPTRKSAIVSALGEVDYDHKSLSKYIDGLFERTLLALEVAVRDFPNSQAKREWVQRIQDMLDTSEVDLQITWRDGRFFPKGAEELDEPLIRQPLTWLGNAKLEAAAEPFRRGLRSMLRAHNDADARLAAVRDFYEALEALARLVCDNSARLGQNAERFLQKLKVTDDFRQMLKAYINYGCWARHAVENDEPRPDVSYAEAESYMYITGLFIRLWHHSTDAR